MTISMGLAGAGRRAAATYAPAIAGCDQVRFSGVWSHTPEAARAVAENYGVPAYTDYDEFVAACQAVAFAVPPAAQPDLAAAAARRGNAILLEKPIAADLASAEQLAKALDRARVVSMVALPWRFAAAVAQFLDDDVPAVRAVGGNGRLITTAPGTGVAEWLIPRGLLRGGGVDLLDLLDAALGTIVAVRAHGDPQGWVGLMLEHQGGPMSEASLYAAVPEAASPSEVAELGVYGPGGVATINLAGAVELSAAVSMVSAFAQAVQDGTPQALGVDHGRHLQDVIEEAESYLLLSD